MTSDLVVMEERDEKGLRGRQMADDATSSLMRNGNSDGGTRPDCGAGNITAPTVPFRVLGE